jgi:hypothetical protein
MAILLTPATRSTLRRLGQVFGLWYALIITGSVILPFTAVEPGAIAVWPLLLRHGADHHCVMCGLTRSFLAMARGEVAAAFQLNGAGPVLYVVMVLLATWAVGSIGRDLGILRWPATRRRQLRRA